MLAPSSRTRVFQYLPFLHGRGIETRIITVLPDRAIAGSQVTVTARPLRKAAYYLWATWRTLRCGLSAGSACGRFDLLFIQKVILPAPVRLMLRWRRVPIIFDFDDAIFTTEVGTTSGGGWLVRWKQRRNTKGLPAMLGLARKAIVENDYTGDYAARLCPVAKITGPIDTSLFRKAPVNGQGKVVLGWIGSATSVQYLELIKGPLSRLAHQYPQVIVRVVGANGWQLPGVNVETKDWRLEEEGQDLADFDVGLMPIIEDSWTLGKGGYKLLQYMASALPVVASPVGINNEIVQDGVTGFLADSDREWEDRLAQLVQDASLRQRMGAGGRTLVENRYSLSTQQQQFLDILTEVADSGRYL
jgi:glycosyltransferase involved in cell wall biosynthesis